MAQAKQNQIVRSAVLSGTGRDVIRQLNRSLERRTVAVTFADDEQGAAAERVIHQVVEFLPQLIQDRQEETLKKVVNVLLADVTPSKAARKQARMLIEAKTSILKQRGFSSGHGSREDCRIQFDQPERSAEQVEAKPGDLCDPARPGDYLPLYGLDPGDHRPRKEMAEILNVFGDVKDGWGLAFWFAGLNSFLDDERPQDVLASDPKLVIAAAKDEMAELQHG